MKITPEILDRLEKLEEKYTAMGQDMVSYLDGLLHADFLTYWDYIHLDTLLSLQTPRTPFPDEKIFIMYHQITELYLKLILHECGQITSSEKQPTIGDCTLRLQRINRYVEHLSHSYDVMVDGMDKQQFLQFRMALLPASGFQSGQYRLLEIVSTDLINLVSEERREAHKNTPLDKMLAQIYWKSGATELSTGKKTLTLKQFEAKYADEFLETAQAVEHCNLWQRYKQFKAAGKDVSKLAQQLRNFDLNLNVRWKLSHYRSAVRYLHKDPEDIKATGGTNWQKYLPPRFQRCIFYPELFTEKEIAEWGKAWVLEQFKETDTK